jgi:hypothetical protein
MVKHGMFPRRAPGQDRNTNLFSISGDYESLPVTDSAQPDIQVGGPSYHKPDKCLYALRVAAPV